MSKSTISSLEFVLSEINAALATGTNMDLLLKVPAAVVPPQAAGVSPFFAAYLDLSASLQPAAAANQAFGQITLFEAPTSSADGAARTPQCLNRGVFGGVPTSQVVVSSGPTVSAPGTQLESSYLTWNEHWESECWLLKPATNYLVRLTNTTATVAILASIKLDLCIVPLKDVLYSMCDD